MHLACQTYRTQREPVVTVREDAEGALEGVSKDICRKAWGKCIIRLLGKKQQAEQEHPLVLLGKATMLAKLEGTAPCVLSSAECNQAIPLPLSLLN